MLEFSRLDLNPSHVYHCGPNEGATYHGVGRVKGTHKRGSCTRILVMWGPLPSLGLRGQAEETVLPVPRETWHQEEGPAGTRNAAAGEEIPQRLSLPTCSSPAGISKCHWKIADKGAPEMKSAGVSLPRHREKPGVDLGKDV